MQRSGLLIIISSPSGAGKSTLARRLMEWDPTLRFSVSATTRPPRPGEVEGQHYYFMDRAAFDENEREDDIEDAGRGELVRRVPREDATRRPLADGILVLGELLVLVDVLLLLELPDFGIWRASLLDQGGVED